MTPFKKSSTSETANVLPAPEKQKNVLRAPAASWRVIDPEEEEFIPTVNIGFMGLPGTGKTKFLADLIEAGAKIFTINTDPGMVGEETILAQCIKNGTKDKFTKNFRGIRLSTYDLVNEFFENPLKFYPKLYDYAPDFLVWEGFANWQQTKLSEKVSELYVEEVEQSKSNSKVISETRSEGFKYETQDWGKIRNGTVNGIEDFLMMKNAVTGKLFHHILTMHEAVETISVKTEGGLAKSEEKASGRPAVQGAGKNFLGGGFSLILRTVRDGDKFFYENSTKTLGLTKNRGIDLPSGKFPAEPMKIVEAIEKSYGITLFERS
ncbi:hypothetical protein UFOVP434_11 [uncultured Caudovirales phage]|uniref:Uncharacterized protein n=1 Tax=uncultured Caudovirales phage TaxID=2100421 RepID=A0A6J5M8F5_9CAUD|nr:hypothetical protein UFOVP434_11 [uncultured Caudovirales phage]